MGVDGRRGGGEGGRRSTRMSRARQRKRVGCCCCCCCCCSSSHHPPAHTPHLPSCLQFAFNTLQRVSPVSHGVCNVVKRVAIIFSSVFFFNQVRAAWLHPFAGGLRCALPSLFVGAACM